MATKTLLNESQVRQFMKLACLEPLTQGFVEGLKERRQTRPPGGGPGGGGTSHGRSSESLPGDSSLMREDDDELESELHATEDELGAEDRVADEEADALDTLEDEGEGRMISVDDFLTALESALEGVMGDEVEIDADEMSDEVEDDVELDAGDDVEMDVAVEDELELQESEEEALTEKAAFKKGQETEAGGKADESPTKGQELTRSGKGRGEKKGDEAYVNEGADELVEQITKRVAARILKSALSKK